MSHRSLFIISLVSLLLIFTLAGCGGGGGGHRSETTPFSAAVEALYPSLGIEDFFSNATGAIRKQSIGLTWDSVDFSNVQFSNVVSNVVITGDTATATVSFTVSGNYVMSGQNYLGSASFSPMVSTTPPSPTPTPTPNTGWTASGSITLQGSGTINFIKVNEVWTIASIPGGISLANAAGAPTIGTMGFSPNPVTHGADLTVSAYISDNSGAAATRVGFSAQGIATPHLGYLIATRGFGGSSSVPMNTYTSQNFTYSTLKTIVLGAPLGNNYGAINVWQLLGYSDGTTTTYRVMFSSQINMVVVTQTSN
jgi:hypothetical protein